MTTLTQQLDRIGNEVVMLLGNYKIPLSQSELHKLSKLKLSEYGWSFALDKLERNNKVEFVSPDRWKLKDFDCTMYIPDYQSFKVQCLICDELYHDTVDLFKLHFRVMYNLNKALDNLVEHIDTEEHLYNVQVNLFNNKKATKLKLKNIEFQIMACNLVTKLNV